MLQETNNILRLSSSYATFRLACRFDSDINSTAQSPPEVQG